MNNQEIVQKYQNEFLEIINNIEEFTTSDLQGAIEAKVSILVKEAQSNIDKDTWEMVGNENDWGLIR